MRYVTGALARVQHGEATLTITHILCPTDFSEPSRHAAEQAIAIARQYRASITVLHTYMPVLLPALQPAAAASGDAIPDAAALARLHDETRAPFQGVADEGLHVEAIVEMGPTVATILDRAATLPADLIVMGTHGTSGFEHLMLGSVTEKVLRKARCPVLTVPPRAKATSRLRVEHLICAVDFSDSSLAALELALSLAQEGRARLTLLHVLEWPWDEPPPPRLDELPNEMARQLAAYRHERERHMRERLEQLVPDEVRAACQVDVELAHGKSYVELLRAATEVRADMIVLGVRGHHRLEVLAFGSTANQVVRRATCPVLTVRR